MPRVSVVIPNWNGAHWLDPCFDALEKQTLRDFEVVVVDNGSTDASLETLSRRRATGALALRVVELPQNVGFAAGINAGISTCTADYIAALNNDTVPCPGWLAALVEALDADPAAGSAASAMLSLAEPDRIDTIGDGYRWDGRAYKIGNGGPASRMPETPFPVFGACAGAALYRRRMLDGIGLFDERYFAYMEDVDLAIRARLAGWTCTCVPQAVVLHAGAGSSGGVASDFSVRLTVKNVYATILKSVPAPLTPFVLLASLATLFGGMVTAVLFDRPRWMRPRLRAVISGMQAAVREAPAMLATRGRTQAGRKLSTLAFVRLLIESAQLRRRFAKGTRPMPIRVLFIVPHPVEGPSTRFRVHQFLPYLRANGVEAELRPLLTSDEARAVYGSGGVLRKGVLTLRAALRRTRDVMDAGRFDLVYILREAFPFGPPWFERALARRAGRMIFDFDDAIYTPSTSYRNPLDRLRDWSKPAALVRRADAVVPGSDVLAGFARRHRSDPARIEVLPTVVDADVYRPDAAAREPGRVTIGWIGTPRNTSYLHPLRPAFEKVASAHPEARFVFVGAEPFDCGSAAVTFREWRLEREIADLCSFDIGIMPLADDEQARGKCGFKLIEYMAVGAACVASPVGANPSILDAGRTGLFAVSAEDWADALSRLVADADLRRRMGAAGRARVESRFCLNVVAPRLLATIRGAVGAPDGGREQPHRADSHCDVELAGTAG